MLSVYTLMDFLIFLVHCCKKKQIELLFSSMKLLLSRNPLQTPYGGTFDNKNAFKNRRNPEKL
jgi:hypothetical protein